MPVVSVQDTNNFSALIVVSTLNLIVLDFSHGDRILNMYVCMYDPNPPTYRLSGVLNQKHKKQLGFELTMN